MLKKSQIDEKVQCWRFMDCLKTHCRTWLDFTAARSEKTPLLMGTLVTQMNQNTQLWRAERLNEDDVASKTTRHWKEAGTIKYTNHCSSSHPHPKCCLIFIDPSWVHFRAEKHRSVPVTRTNQAWDASLEVWISPSSLCPSCLFLLPLYSLAITFSHSSG